MDDQPLNPELPGGGLGNVRCETTLGRTISLDEVPEGYRAMNDRESIKVLIQL